MFEKGTLIRNRYEIEIVLNSGGMSDFVGVCIDRKIISPESYADERRRRVVVKAIRLNQQDRTNERTYDEVITSLRLAHTNVVETFDIYNDKDYVYIVMEYINGRNLSDKISDRGSIQFKEAYMLFSQVCNGIRHMHNLPDKIIHLDIKPDNIFLTLDGSTAKVSDFGISTILNAEDIVIRGEKIPMGTAGYISPDYLFKGARPIGPQYDIFALGAVFFEMLTGEIPFKPNSDIKEGGEAKSSMEKALNFLPPLLTAYDSEIPHAYYNIIFRCLVSQEEFLHFRYKNLDELIADLETANDPTRMREPLLIENLNGKFEKRVFINNFSVPLEQAEEKFYFKRWFMLLVSSSIFGLLVIGIIVLTVITNV